MYLGHLIRRDGICPDPRLVSAVTEFPVPTSVPSVRSFVGLAGYYRSYIPNFSVVALPLTELMKKEASWQWGPRQQKAFEHLRSALAARPVLAYPDFDREFIVKPDWSAAGIGAVLTQIDADGDERPIAYLSRRCRGKESVYCALRGELVAIWYAVSKWRSFLEGREFLILSDHLSLQFLRDNSDDQKLQRCVNELQHFSFRVVHKSGVTHRDADALSRCHDRGPSDGSDLVDDTPHMYDYVLSIDSERLPDYHFAVYNIDATTPSDDRAQCDLSPATTAAIRQMIFEQQDDPFCQSLREKLGNNYYLSSDGLLRRRGRAPFPDQVVIPASARRRYFDLYHGTRSGGHFGRDRTIGRLQLAAYWPNMTRDVVDWCRACTCTRDKQGRPIRTGYMYVKPTTPDLPWSTIHIDHYGPLNRTSAPDNFRYVMTVVCATTHSPRWIPTRTTAAKETALRLLDVFSSESFPRRIVTDRHGAFVNELLKELSLLCGFSLAVTVAGRAQGNSLAERPHRFLTPALKATTNDDQTDWHLTLPLLSLAYRAGVHPALGETPFFLERGRDPNMPTELPATPVPKRVEVREFRRAMIRRLATAIALAQRLDRESQERSKRYYDHRRLPTRLEVGQLVWVWRDPPASANHDSTRRSLKLVSTWTGPWRLIEQLSDNKFRAQHIRDGTIDKFEADMLVPAHVEEDVASDAAHNSDDEFAWLQDSDSEVEDLADVDFGASEGRGGCRRMSHPERRSQRLRGAAAVITAQRLCVTPL